MLNRHTILVIFFVLFASSCNRSKENKNSIPIQTDTVKTLSQMSREQLHVFLKGYQGDWRNDSDKSKNLPAPPIEKPYPKDAVLIDLIKHEDIHLGTMPLNKAIDQRRSRKVFTKKELTIEELSYLLWCTQGISKVVRNDSGKPIYSFRTVPSGGARHSFETYLAINRVPGIKPGIYRYLAIEHKLMLVHYDDNLPTELTNACYGQEFIGEAAVVFIWSTIPYRTEWKYAYLAPKLVAVDAGHVCENLYLATESIGGSTCAILGYNQKAMDSLINVDGDKEFTFYLAPVGK